MCDECKNPLGRIEDFLEDLLKSRPPLDDIHMLSATQPYILDYKERKHVFVWALNDLNLSLEELGSITISANTWTEISFIAGTHIFATNQTNPVAVFIRCADEMIDGVAAGTASFLPITNIATLSSVGSSATAVQLLAANPNRKGLFIFNESNQILYIAYTTVANTSITNYTIQVPAGGLWEMPIIPVYTGIVSGIWAAVNGNARITEET